jgi:hypothetical protein
MSKKSKNKKRYRFSKQEFVEIVCSKCRICQNDTDPIFCFSEVYKDKPKIFINNIFPKLVDFQRELIEYYGYPNISYCEDDDINKIVKECFCKSNYCKKGIISTENCDYIAGCIFNFRKQIMPSNSIVGFVGNLLSSTKIKKKEKAKWKKKKARYVPEPYPTMFCNEGFKGEIMKILEECANENSSE